MSNRVLDLIKAMTANPANDNVTTANTPAANDNSKRVATTDWLYSGCMAFIATAAGFASSTGTNGYIKLPSWLGGFIIQYGREDAVTAGGSKPVIFPIPFPNALLCPIATVLNTGGQPAAMSAGVSTGNINGMTVFHNGSSTPTAISWLAIGR